MSRLCPAYVPHEVAILEEMRATAWAQVELLEPSEVYRRCPELAEGIVMAAHSPG